MAGGASTAAGKEPADDRAEEAGRRERRAALFDALPVPVALVDDDGLLIDGNQAFARLAEYAATELGRSALRLYFARPDGSGVNLRLLARAMPSPCQLELNRKFGGRVDLACTLNWTAQAGGWCVTVVDSASRAPGDETAPATLAAALDHLPHPISVWDEADQLRFANAAFRSFTTAEVGPLPAGIDFASYIGRVRAASGAALTPPGWLDQRLALHANPAGPFELPLSDGRRLMVTEARLPGGGTVTLYSDITPQAEVERRLAQTVEQLKDREQALKRSLRRLEEAERIAHLGYWEQDLATGTGYFTEEFCRMLGETVATMVPTFKAFADRLEPEERRRLIAASQSAFAGAGNAMLELRFRRRDGTLRHLRFWGYVERDAQGKPHRTAGVVLDITAERTTELALRESEARLLDFASASSDWFWETGPDHRFTWFSSGAFDLALRSPASIQVGGTRWEISGQSPDHPTWRGHVDDLEHRRPFRDFRYQVLRTDGQPGWISVSGRPRFVDGVFAGYRGVAADVSVAVAAETALRASEERFRRAFDDGLVGMALIGADGRFLAANHALLGMIGVAEAAIAGKTMASLADPDEPDPGWAWLERAWSDPGQPSYDGERRVRHPDGRTVWLRVGAVMVRDGARPLHAIAQFQDVTDQKRALAELAKAKEAAEAASHAKSMFLGNMSHELRTPLNAVMGFGQIIADALFGPLDERYRGYGRDIVLSGQHLLELIDEILDTARLEVGAYRIAPAPVALAGLIGDAARMLRDRAARGGLTLDLPAIDPGETITVDARAIRQVLINLLANAIKFTPPGGHIAVSVARKAGAVEIAVSDSGVGIAQADLERIFVPFVQVERERGRFHEGAGLGLPLSRRLVEMHGGTLRPESHPGHGSRFVIMLPID